MKIDALTYEIPTLPEQSFDHESWLYEEVTVMGLQATDEILPPVELYQSVIKGAILTGVTLRRWTFESCVLIDCDLSNVTLEECAFESCRLINCKLIGSDWRPCARVPVRVSFLSCDLSLSLMSGLSLRAVCFQDCRCHETDFKAH